MKGKIYLDNNATTFCDARVAQSISELLFSNLGNPSSIHSYGQEAKALVLNSQRILAQHIGCKPSSIVFTSGGTESLNYCLQGYCEKLPAGRIVTTAVEHAAVDTTLSDFEEQGWKVDRVPVSEKGAVDINAVSDALLPDTKLLVAIAANNETGVKNDLAALAQLAEGKNIPLLLDGVSWLGKERIPNLPGRVMWCFSAHKIHGPTGIGIAVVPPGIKLHSLITGGPQQQGRRGGTENIPGIVGFANAVTLLDENFEENRLRMANLRDFFESELFKLSDVARNGSGERICNTSNLSFAGVDGETLMIMLDQEGIAASMGSACSSGSIEPSRILLQMGYSRERTMCSIRFSLSRMTTEDEIKHASEAIKRVVSKLRSR